MAYYDRPKLARVLASMEAGSSGAVFDNQVIPYLVDVWIDDYARETPSTGIVETAANGFSYLFDIAHERLIAAWGISRGRHGEPRDKTRMAGHPLSNGPHYHRGHAIPHTLGGPTDINLVPQLGSVNVGAFRELEREAVDTPGALYFTYWIYQGSTDQRPRRVEQGLLCPGRFPEIREHPN
jgi:hypothetical protein